MSDDTTTSGSDRYELKDVQVVGEIGPEDEPVKVATQPLRDFHKYEALGTRDGLKRRGWRNVRIIEVGNSDPWDTGSEQGGDAGDE